MQPELVTKPAFTVVGMLLHTRTMAPEIPQLWEHFGPRMDEVPDQAEPGVSYGVMQQGAAGGDALDYMAGVAVVQALDVPAGMTSWEIPAQTYAVLPATLPTLGAAFDFIYNTWLPASGYQPTGGPFFERYGATFDPSDPTSELSIYVPVEKVA